MSVIIQQARAWFEGRTRREQILLAIMGVMLIAILGWFAVVTPIQGWRENAAERRIEAADALASVQADVARINAAARSGPTGSGEPIEPLLIRTAEQSGLTLVRQQAESDGAQTAWLEGAPPQAAFGWIATLEASHGVTVSNLTALKSPEGGLDLQVSFRQAVR